MLKATRVRWVMLNDSNMRRSSAGTAPHTGPHRVRMPWTTSTERTPFMVYQAKDRTLLEGVELFKGIGRIDMLEPLLAVKAICAKRDHLTSTGLSLFQVATHLQHNGRGQLFWRDGWRDGTCDKYITLSRVVFERDIGQGGEAWGYLTFQGETTMRPILIKDAALAGWHCEFDERRAVPPSRIVDPPPSIGTEVPVDPKQYKLKAYPYYDAPTPVEWEVRRKKEMGVIPDPVAGDDTQVPDPNVDDGSVHVEAKK